MTRPPNLLLVEDDRSIREPLVKYLEKNDVSVAQAHDAADARKMMLACDFDLVLLDIMMPGEDGLSLCRYIREARDTPVIMLSAKADDFDRVIGMEMGADDYIVKPFNPRELLARVKAVIRRANALPGVRQDMRPDAYAFADWIFRTGERELIGPDAVAVPLSTREFALLLTFVERPKIVLTREHLLDLTQRPGYEVYDRSIDNLVSRLRRKVEPDVKAPTLIKTVWGGGYCFTAEVRRV